jgi:3-oxoacyl-[acyl-carrier-protein] synthase-3
MTNAELATRVVTSDEWIRSRTGISERRIAHAKEHTSTMALEAGRQALAVADLDPAKLDLIILATCTPDFLMPATACLVQDALGASRAAAFDLNTACSGFVYAVAVAAEMIRAGAYDNVLVIGSETMSRVLDWTDRSTCVLFGDGAGAVVLQAREVPGGILTFSLGSDGSGGDLLKVAIGTRTPLETMSNGAGYMKMNGREVYRFATRIMVRATKDALAAAGLSTADVDLVIPHQANTRILESAARLLGLSPDRMYVNLDRYGNTSAASVPIALCEALEDGAIAAGDHVVLVGFGGGLTWGACVIEWAATPRAEPWPLWRRALLWSRYRLARVRSLAHRADRKLAALEDRLLKRGDYRLRNGD